MFGTNPFAPAMQSLPAGFMEWYLCLMAAAVIVGVLVDITHKGSAKYFFASMKESRAKKGARKSAAKKGGRARRAGNRPYGRDCFARSATNTMCGPCSASENSECDFVLMATDPACFSCRRGCWAREDCCPTN